MLVNFGLLFSKKGVLSLNIAWSKNIETIRDAKRANCNETKDTYLVEIFIYLQEV